MMTQNSKTLTRSTASKRSLTPVVEYRVFLTTGSDEPLDGKLLLDSEDVEAFGRYDEFRLSAGRPQIKKKAWKRWKDVDVYLVGCVCAPRDGNFCNLTRDNLIPCQAAWMKYK